MSSRYWDSYPSYPKTTRIATEDGIRSRKAGKGFATKWWARHWIQALDSFGWSNRLQRGRSYARSGQVLEYQVQAGEVRARVQGSRKTPYQVTLRLRHLDPAQWDAVLEVLASRAAFAARLLAGEMPEDVEEAFKAAGAALMPASSKELATSCSCPDWANPCKHVAAVHYILAEALDEDPFLVFRLRGRTREQVMEELRARRAGPCPDTPAAEPASEPLPVESAAFWGTCAEGLDLDFSLPPQDGATLLGRGAPGGWASEERLLGLLAPAMRAVAQAARDAVERARSARPDESEPGEAEVPASRQRSARARSNGPSAAKVAQSAKARATRGRIGASATADAPAAPGPLTARASIESQAALAAKRARRPKPAPDAPRTTVERSLAFEFWAALALAAEGNLSQARLSEMTGESIARTRDRLRHLLDEGLLLREGHGRATRYTPTPEGQRVLQGG